LGFHLIFISSKAAVTKRLPPPNEPGDHLYRGADVGRNNKEEEDTFGEKDSDWDVYKQISREAEDSDSEEETLRAQVNQMTQLVR